MLDAPGTLLYAVITMGRAFFTNRCSNPCNTIWTPSTIRCAKANGQWSVACWRLKLENYLIWCVFCHFHPKQIHQQISKENQQLKNIQRELTELSIDLQQSPMQANSYRADPDLWLPAGPSSNNSRDPDVWPPPSPTEPRYFLLSFSNRSMRVFEFLFIANCVWQQFFSSYKFFKEEEFFLLISLHIRW